MTYLCIDLGEKRIGIAISDKKGLVAQPVSIIKRTSDEEAIEEIMSLCSDRNVDSIILGVPYSASEEVQHLFRSFGEKFVQSTGLPLHEWDETFSTKQAQNVIAFSDQHSLRKKTKDHRDDVAAAIILQEYLDHEYRKKNRENSNRDSSD